MPNLTVLLIICLLLKSKSIGCHLRSSARRVRRLGGGGLRATIGFGISFIVDTLRRRWSSVWRLLHNDKWSRCGSCRVFRGVSFGRERSFCLADCVSLESPGVCFRDIVGESIRPTSPPTQHIKYDLYNHLHEGICTTSMVTLPQSCYLKSQDWSVGQDLRSALNLQNQMPHARSGGPGPSDCI